MPGLALISRNPELHQALVAALEATHWSVEWLTPQDLGDGGLKHEVVALDAAHPGAADWKPRRGTAILLVVQGEYPYGLDALASDFVAWPTRPKLLLARLERLRARNRIGDLPGECANAFASMTMGIVLLDQKLEILTANPRALEITGHRKDTIVSQDIGRLLSAEDLPRVREALAQGQYPRATDVHLVRRDGTTFVCSASFAPLKGAEDHTVISFEDVTLQRQTEQELVQTMEFLESLIDASVDAIIATDMEQRVRLFNASAERITGYHESDVIGSVTLEDLLGRATADLVRQRVLSADHGGEGRLEPTMLDLLDIHGSRIPVQLSASLIYEKGAPSAIVLIFADLRDRIRVEERLADAQKKLAFTEKQGVLAELAGTAAHELNQPLTSMMAYAELLLRQSEPDSSGAKAARVLIREAERMAEIVRKIAKITRYETTSYVGHQKIFDLDRAADGPTDPGAKG